MRILFSFLSLLAFITFSQNANATNICTPAPLGDQDDANKYCPNTCTNAGGTWGPYYNWNGTSDNSCGSNNQPGSVCGCTIVTNSTNFCSPGLLYDNDEAKAACPETCKKAGGTWNHQWVGTSDTKCTGSNDRGSVCGCSFTGCSVVTLDYDRNETPLPNWVADAWYTPCGSNQEAGTAWYAHEWTNNKLSIATGTRLQIGQEGKSYSSIDQVITEPKLHVICRGDAFGLEQQKDPPCCRDASVPLPPCTNVILTYDKGVTWTASIQHTPCSKCGPKKEVSTPITNTIWTQITSIKSDTSVKIGPAWTNTTYINQNMSGHQVFVFCYGKILEEQGSGCCVVGSPNCPPKNQPKVTTKAKKKAPKKASGETKEPPETPGETKGPQETPAEPKTPKETPPAETKGPQETPAETKAPQETPAETKTPKETPGETKEPPETPVGTTGK